MNEPNLSPAIGNDPAHDSRVTGVGDRAAVRPAIRIALIVVGLAIATFGMSCWTGGWLGVPSRRPTVVSYLRDSPEVERQQNFQRESVRGLGGILPWFEQTDVRWADFDGIANSRGRPRTIPYLYVTTTVGPRPGTEWISGGAVAAGLALAAFGATSCRRRSVIAP